MTNELETLLIENGLDPDKIREDYFIDPECRILQNKKHFCFNSDSTDLAKLCRVYPHDQVCEIGTNNGALLVYLDRLNQIIFAGLKFSKNPLNWPDSIWIVRFRVNMRFLSAPWNPFVRLSLIWCYAIRRTLNCQKTRTLFQLSRFASRPGLKKIWI